MSRFATGNRMHSVPFGRGFIEVQVQRSERKTLAISVLPDGAVVATAPKTADTTRVLLRVQKRGRWIQQQRRYFERFLPATPPRKYLSGETHRYLGRQYRLKVSLQRPYEVKLIGQFLRVAAPTKFPEDVFTLVEKWFRARAKEQFTKRLETWNDWCARRGINMPTLQLRKMVKRWGSSKPNGRICLNPELVRAPSICIDYVIAHEVCHLKFPKHDREFYHSLTQVCPNWRIIKQRLEESLS